jgi:hypothetical protein
VKAFAESVTGLDNQQEAEPEFIIERANKISVDGDFSDWSNAQWVKLGGDKWFGDSFEETLTLVVPEGADENGMGSFMGMQTADLTEELKTRYYLEAYSHQEFVVVTEVEPGSAAEAAGIREGDIVLRLGDRKIKFTMEVDIQRQAFAKKPGKKVDIEIRRSGRALCGGDEDLTADVAFLVDDYNLYFAAKVVDDAHVQNKREDELWMQDSVQIGIDPILQQRADGYGDNGHEIGFALRNGKPVAWRWDGRRGQPVGDIKDVDLRVVRRNGMTLYEAAIPLRELMPLSPDMWRKIGIDVVVNDCDVDGVRKGRIELAGHAMTHGKHPAEFAAFEFAPSGNPRKVSGGLMWNERCWLVGGGADLTLVVSSPQTEAVVVIVELLSLDDPDTAPARTETTVAVSPEPRQYHLVIPSDSPVGRYRLKIAVRSESGWVAAEDELPVYVYR